MVPPLERDAEVDFLFGEFVPGSSLHGDTVSSFMDVALQAGLDNFAGLPDMDSGFQRDLDELERTSDQVDGGQLPGGDHGQEDEEEPGFRMPQDISHFMTISPLGERWSRKYKTQFTRFAITMHDLDDVPRDRAPYLSNS